MAMLPRLWSLSGLSVELGIDRRTLAAQLASVPPDGKTGARDGWRLTTVLGALGWGKPARTKGARVSGNADYELWRARWMRQRAIDAEREAKVREGQLVEREPYLAAQKEVWSRILLQARARFLAFPSRLAAYYPGLKTQADVFKWATVEVRKILQILADAKPVAVEGPYKIPVYAPAEEAEDDVEADEVEDATDEPRRT
jgi:hypothetical protein